MTQTPPMPPGYLDTPAAWRSADLAPGEWAHVLSVAEAAEIAAAARALAARDLDLATVTAADFPLPAFGPRLAALHRGEVLEGRGFAVIRGLDPQAFSRRENGALFLGIGAHLGAFRPQNAAGHILGHVKDLGRSGDDPNARLYQTHERQTYHTDSCDVVGLYCLKPAKAGGRSSLVSSVTLYNEMRRRAPELAAALFQPIETDRRGEVAAGELPWFNIPVFNWFEGCFAGMYQRQYIESARRFSEVPPLTETQVAALDLLDALAEDPALHLEIDFQPGDIQLVNNHVLFHDRTAFEDWPEPERRRHLLRLWLAPPDAQALPPVFAERFGTAAPGARGGVTVSPDRWVAPLEA
ncbi:MAG: TauD/TfdA family dioxygenase [Phenylobacterium sp.]|nr:MAG: TauD/TfdA family dioxygenase [Phenylobacterium sp.]